MKKFAGFLAFLMLVSAAALAADVEWTSVQSSLIDRIFYEAETQTLAIQMHNSSDVFYYADVPAALYDDFLSAPSKGAFYVKKIKGQFKSRKEQ
ncbi:MAG: KTSC domain-containing protein [Kiritimatiellia bacterium]